MFPLSDQQRLFLVESTQLYHAWREADAQSRQHKYGMRWLTSQGKAYLIRLSDAKGNGKSLGARNSETEAVYNAFMANKARAKTRLDALSARLANQSKLNKAVGLGRVPSVVADILKALAQARVEHDFRLIGTHALYAYESLAGVHCKMDLLASGDVDLLYDPRKKISIMAAQLDHKGLIGLLQTVDKSFELQSAHAYRAVNDKGYMVDFIVPMQGMQQPSVQFAATDLQAVEIDSMQWLANAPAIDVIVIASNGAPVSARVPDPRVYALHKAWLSQQAMRDPIKKPRDLGQAKLVFEMLTELLPNYPLDKAHMRYMPKAVWTKAIQLLTLA